MAEKCARCRASGSEVMLYDAIYDGRMANLCERCSVIENIPIIRKPSSDQLRDTEKSHVVYDRMRRLSGMGIQRRDTFFREDRLNELDKNPELELPEKERLNLIPHYYWVIMKYRRKKGLTQEKLAETIGESVSVIKMIEKGRLPENAKVVLNKLEQFFQINLKLVPKELPVKRGPILLDSQGHELDAIPEPKIKKNPEYVEVVDLSQPKFELDNIIENIGEDNEVVYEGPLDKKPGFFAGSLQKIRNAFKNADSGQDDLGNEGDVPDEDDKNAIEIDIKKINPAEVTIGDLKEIHRRKVQATRQEQLEEQKRIEERQRLIEARKEELRLRREKESRELDHYLGGSELIGKNKKNKISPSDNVKEFDEELK